MRVPKVLASCLIVAVLAVTLMVVGSISEMHMALHWALLMAVLAGSMGIVCAVQQAAETIKVYISRYAFEVFEDGFRSGVDTGREMEAAERFTASLAGRNKN